MQMSRFEAVVEAVDAENAQDPRHERIAGERVPAELLYSRRMTERMQALYPDASETLRIAARAQHIRRWTTPRSRHPEGKAGYHAWRIACRKMHAETVAKIMAKQGYGQADIDQVGKLIRKEGLKSDPDSQRLQNVVGLVFIEHYLEDFAADRSDEQLVDILRKTARKLDADATGQIARLDLSPRLAGLIAQATR